MRQSSTSINAGFIPLIDAAILIVARELGFARAEDIDLNLFRELSWANIRDKTAVGHFDVAHMLAPMPIATNLGLDPLHSKLIVPMALGLNGNTITVSNKLWQKLLKTGAFEPGSPAGLALALAKVTRNSSEARPVFAVVHPVSAHRYELAYLLAYAGLTLGQDIELVVLPPALMTDALESGQISGFCAGEPWGSFAQSRNFGKIATTKAAVWRSSPEKVLGVRKDWADDHPEVLPRLIRALYKAACWCEAEPNRQSLAGILSQPKYLGHDEGLIYQALVGATSVPTGCNAFIFASRAATFPWISHALWFYSQMVRWGQVKYSRSGADLASSTFRPDLYRVALAQTDAPLPSASSKVEGALTEMMSVGAMHGHLYLGPDGFFDAKIFDPDDVEGYLNSFEVKN